MLILSCLSVYVHCVEIIKDNRRKYKAIPIMGVYMEFIFEILVELILEGTFEISKNKKVPKVIRYPLIIFIILSFLGVVMFIFYTGISAYQKINKLCGIIFIIIGIIFIVASIIKYKKINLKKKNNK